ncbi:hypothetical protein EU805_11595 [Salipiger sp. IMCC34102]|uniref:DUF6497 family protein n=1 Tax=Salipiger sp. IMCC34102 TaxID=2510647 RepID=UPI00101BE865|nr:DUF6497 family protein [Salipiger sp. IMCC34102]RYH01831.1 hypothetical protein EU805_11595 [Salipiger sp. IMCC34102]
MAAQELQPISVPSGLEIALADVMLEEEAGIARFRFVSPALSGEDGLTFAEVADDLMWLCQGLVRPALEQQAWTSAQVVLSVSDQPTEFGIYDPNVVQYFQPFRLDGDECRWEDL